MILYGFQSMLFWADNPARLGTLNLGPLSLGAMLDMIGITAISVFTWYHSMSPNTFIFKKTKKKGWVFVLLAIIATWVVYYSIVFTYHWWTLALGIALIILCSYMLELLGADCGRLHFGLGLALVYMSGAYFAMLTNHLDPAITIYGIIAVLLITLSIWIWPDL